MVGSLVFIPRTIRRLRIRLNRGFAGFVRNMGRHRDDGVQEDGRSGIGFHASIILGVATTRLLKKSGRLGYGRKWRRRRRENGSRCKGRRNDRMLRRKGRTD